MRANGTWWLAAIVGAPYLTACQLVAGLPGEVVLDAGTSAGAGGTDGGTGECKPDDTRCDGLQPQTCDEAGTWQDKNEPACPYLCVMGGCMGECKPDDTGCNGLQPQTCDGASTWQDKNEPACPYVCLMGGCTGECKPGDTRCDGLQPQACDGTGAWLSSGASCGAVGWCAGGECVTGTSCLASGDGLSNCGPNLDESCCASPLIPGGMYLRSYDGETYLELDNPATVSDFRLDRFEITVGRFRRFMSALGGGWVPAQGAGKHAHLNGGAGLNDGTELGWDTTWNASLPSAGLACAAPNQNLLTWTEAVGMQEKLPMNCIDWYQAYAFCIWDGGFLPSEAEWNYAAARGNFQRVYPWGNAMPDPAHAVYDCLGDGSAAKQCAFADILPVGSKSPLGDGYWGQADLAGGVYEWSLDWWIGEKSFPNPCIDCASLGPTTPRVIRGGGWFWGTPDLASSSRVAVIHTAHDRVLGARCARAP